MTIYPGISMVLMITAFIAIDQSMTKYLESHSKEYKNHSFDDESFSYANWAKIFEVVILLAFSVLMLFGLLFIDSEEINHPSLMIILAFLVILIIYRFSAWAYEVVYLQGNLLIYTKGRRRKLLKVNLNEIEAVDIRFFRFHIHMKNGKIIKFPTGFKNQAYIYGILKYYRTNGNVS